MSSIRKVSTKREWLNDDIFFSDRPIEGEEWIDFDSIRGKKIRGNYQVSSKGRVRRVGGSIIKGTISFDGYHEISFCNEENPNTSSYVRVHSLVLSLFVGPPPEEMYHPTVQHINHNKLDNRVENLCWMSSFDNNQEGHGRRAKVIDKEGEHIFPSQKVASKYLGRYEDYISEGINYGYKLTKPDGEEVEVWTDIGGEWVKYCRPVPTNRKPCRIVLKGNIHEFESFWECDRFLNKPQGYVSSMIANSWPILPNQSCVFYVYDHSTSSYVEYVPTSRKAKRSATVCKATLPSGEVKIFPTIAKLAEFLGKDAEGVRLKLHAKKPVKLDSGEQVIIEEILE